MGCDGVYRIGIKRKVKGDGPMKGSCEEGKDIAWEEGWKKHYKIINHNDRNFTRIRNSKTK